MGDTVVHPCRMPQIAGLMLLGNETTAGRSWVVYGLVMVLGGIACSGDPVGVERTFSTSSLGLENSCGDGLDEDNDGFVDCADPDCAGVGLCAKAFTCGPGLFQASFTRLLRVDPSQNPFADDNLGTLNAPLSGDLNARDGFGYAIEKDPPYDIIRLFNDGTSEVLNVSSPIPENLNFGVMDLDNNLWLGGSTRTTIDRVNVVTGDVQSFPLSRGPAASDFGFNANDGLMYGLSGREQLFVLDPSGSAPTVTRLESVVTSPDARFEACSVWGAQAFDSSGVLYVFCAGDGLLWAVDIRNFSATFVGRGGPAGENDGFSCSLARPSFEVCNNGRDDDGDGEIDEDGSPDPDSTCVDYPDTDGDGVLDVDDIDDDNDGVLDSQESGDTDGDGLPDRVDLDSDNDGIFDLIEAGHGAADGDNNGRADGAVGANGFLDTLELGDDEDSGANYALNDADGDQVPSLRDLDSDGDGVFDAMEAGLDSSGSGFDADDDGIPDPYDADDAGPGAGDSDDDGIPDDVECLGGWPCPDANADGVPDYADPDLDDDGTVDGSDEDPQNPCVPSTAVDACEQGGAADGDNDPGDDVNPNDPDPCDSDPGSPRCNADTDGDDDRDGLSNAEEEALGTDPNTSDTDGDGFSDKFELENGGDPTVSVVVGGGSASGCSQGGVTPLWGLLVAIAPMLFRRRRRRRD